MNAVELLRLQAAYNRWMNARLYDVCAAMSDDERKRDLEAFFRSIHGTFNHLLLTDRVWLGRLQDRPFPVASLDQELHADYDALLAQRAGTDAEICALVDELVEEDLARIISYTSIVTRTPNALPLGVVLTHLFHHQTHHRGQITALISRLGYDFGETDMIWMPGVAVAPA